MKNVIGIVLRHIKTLIPASFPTHQAFHPSPSAPFHIPFPVSRLHSASQTDSPTARRDLTIELRVLRSCFRVAVTGRLFFFPLSSPYFLHVEIRCSNSEYRSSLLVVWFYAPP